MTQRTRMPPVVWISLAFVLMNLVGLSRSPMVWIDEVTLNDPAKELGVHGRFRSSIFHGYDGYDRGYFWQPPGQLLVMGAVYRVFGFGIWQTRIPGVLLGGGVLAALYLLTANLFDSRRAGLWAAGLFGLDPMFITLARSGRMDAQCLLLSLLSVDVCLRWAAAQATRSPYRSKAILAASGLLVGLAGITHPVAIAWALFRGHNTSIGLDSGIPRESHGPMPRMGRVVVPALPHHVTRKG